MTTTTSLKDLTDRIEDVVREHLAACRRAAEEAVQRVHRDQQGPRGRCRPRPRAAPGADRDGSRQGLQPNNHRRFRQTRFAKTLASRIANQIATDSANLLAICSAKLLAIRFL